MTIGELSRRSGLAPSAIRYYEAEGLLSPARRVSGRRVFDLRALDQLAVIRLAKETGFTLAEVRRLVTEFGRHRWRTLAERKLVEVRDSAKRLEAMAALLTKLLTCECPDLEVCGSVLRARNVGR